MAFAWRAELHHGLWTRAFGERAVARYEIGSTLLVLARPLGVLGLAIANRGTLSLPAAVAWTLGLACFAPGVRSGCTMRRYFPLDRAYCIDHFDASYRGAPLVREGIFRLTPNAMYVFGFLALWGLALVLRSRGALVAAAFHHAAIWVHYLCTERPDLRRIHGLP